MEIKRFNESLYSEEVNNFIIRNEYDKEQTKYYLTIIGENPIIGASFKKLENAINYLVNYYKMLDDSDQPHLKKYCIYKSTIQAVSEEEIDIILKSKKYGL